MSNEARLRYMQEIQNEEYYKNIEHSFEEVN